MKPKPRRRTVRLLRAGFRRFAVTLPFFLLSLIVLVIWGRPVTDRAPVADRDAVPAAVLTSRTDVPPPTVGPAR
jgi:hypothetical protein